jgi:hypothetical protein
MATNLNAGLNNGLNPGLRQSISGGVDRLGLFRSASLDLRFADKKTLTDRVSGTNLITFSRASSGTYVGSDGLIKTAVTDAPRFDHDPVTGESLGLLIEESRTNLITSSSDIAGFFTQQNSTATADAAAAPDGTVTADLIVPDTSSSTHASFNNTSLSFSASTTYSYSIFVKPNGYSWLQLVLTSGFNNLTAWVNFDLTGAGSFGFTGGGEISKEIESHPGGWYRCTITATSGASAFAGGPAYLILDSNRNGRDEHYAGDDTSGIYLWGAQVEEGSFPTSYIPTTTSTVTRSPDIATIEGTNFSSWYNQSEGTIFTDISPLAAASGRGYLFSNGSNDQRLGQNTDDVSNYALFMSNGSTTSLSAAASGMPKPIKACLAYKPGSSRGVIDGALKILSTTNNVPDAINQVGIGFQNYAGSSGFLDGHISRLAYFPVRKTDQELIDLTKS